MAGWRAAIEHPKGENCGRPYDRVQAPGRLSEQGAKLSKLVGGRNGCEEDCVAEAALFEGWLSLL